MLFIDAKQIDEALSFPKLIDVIGDAFKTGAIAPPRHHHHIPLAGRPEATWLLMPAVTGMKGPDGALVGGPYMGVKSVTVFPDNGVRSGKPAIYGTYLLLSTETGETLAVLDATRLTVWRTAAASALAARHLARGDAQRMLMVGAGALAPFLIRAHASVRPIRSVSVWNRNRPGAEAIAELFAGSSLDVRVCDDLEAAARRADIISTATLSAVPLVRGAWLHAGTHVDSVGAYRADLRETDDDLVLRSRVFVDTLAGAFGEAGDILQPLKAGLIGREHVLGDLAELEAGAVGRLSASDITFFKSVGASIEDLAAAIAVYEHIRQSKA